MCFGDFSPVQKDLHPSYGTPAKKAVFWPQNRLFWTPPGPGMTPESLNGPKWWFPMDLGVLWPMIQIMCRLDTNSSQLYQSFQRSQSLCLILVWYLFDIWFIFDWYGYKVFPNVPLKEISLEQVVCKQKKFHICLIIFDSYLFDICLIFLWCWFDSGISFFPLKMSPQRRSVSSRWFVWRRSFLFVKCLIHICLIFVKYLFDVGLIGISGFLNVSQEEICLEQMVCKQKKFHIC